MDGKLTIALAGNPNSGKTTLFNALTGSTQFVGNWPGVTVEKKEGRLKENKDVILSKVANALIKYNMEAIADKKVRELSKYDKLRLSIARLALRKLDLLIIDDVFADLDAKEQSQIIEFINELTEFEDVTSVIATSNKKLCERLGNNIIKIKFGSIE